MALTELPVDVLLSILSFLSVEDTLYVRQVQFFP